MALVTQAHTYLTGEVLTAINMNANPIAFVAGFANIDNTNIGAAGIYASQVKPTSIAQATFGGAIGYTISPQSTTQIPLTIAGIAAQAVDLLDVLLTPGGTKAVWIDSGGLLHANQAPTAPGYTATANMASGGTNVSYSGDTVNAYVHIGGGGSLQVSNASGAAWLPIESLGANFHTGNLTNIGALTATGTVAGGTFSGSGASLTGIPNGALTNSTISGVALGSNLFSLTPGTHLSGSTYNGSAAVTWTTDATNANTASTIVARDGGGNFAMTTLTATSATLGTAGTPTNALFIGSDLVGGTQQSFLFTAHSTTVAGVAADILGAGQSGTSNLLALDKTGKLGALGLTLGDATDSTKRAAFAMSSISTGTTRTYTFPDVSGNFVTTGDTSTVTNTMLAGSIANAKLANSTISGVALGSNLANLSAGTHFTQGAYNGSAGITLALDATNANTASTIVARDGSGNFAAGAPTFAGKVIAGATAQQAVVTPISLDVQGADGFNVATNGTNALAALMSTTAAGTDKGAVLVLGGQTGNVITSYAFGAIRGAKQGTSGDGNYGGTLDFFTQNDAGSMNKALRLDKGLAAIFAGPVSGITSLAIGGALTGATTVNASGLGTFVGLTAGTGTVQGSSNGSTVAYVPPVYTAAGAITASTAHIVQGSILFSGTNTGTVTLSGAAVFANAASYSVAVIGSSTVPGVMRINPSSGSSFTIDATNSGTYTVNYIAIGT